MSEQAEGPATMLMGCFEEDSWSQGSGGVTVAVSPQGAAQPACERLQ